MRMLIRCALLLAILGSAPALAQQNYPTVPPVKTYCSTDGVTWAACNPTGGGGGGGSNAAAGPTGAAVPSSASYTGFSDGSGNNLGVAAASGRYLPVQDYLLDALISGGSLSVSISGSPTFTATGTVTANLGTLNGAATAAGVAAVNTTLGSPMQNSGGSVTANLGTLNGAATAANQPTLNGDGGAPAHVTNFPATQPISAASLPLPTGAMGATGGTVGLVAGAANIGTVPLAVATAGGETRFRTINGTADNMANRVKNGAGQLYGWIFSNTNAAACYVHFYNSISNPPVPGTTAVNFSVVVPGTTPGNAPVSYHSDIGIAFGTGIGVATTCGSMADSDTTGVATANTFQYVLFYN